MRGLDIISVPTFTFTKPEVAPLHRGVMTLERNRSKFVPMELLRGEQASFDKTMT